MSHLIQNTFAAFAMTPAEELEGSILTISQIQVLQNDLAANAEEMLVLEFDPLHPELYSQQESYKRGQMDILRFIMDRSMSSIEIRDNPEPAQEPNL